VTRRLRLAVRLPLLPPPEKWTGGAKLVFLLVFALLISMGVRSVFGERGLVEWLRMRTEVASLERDVAAMKADLAREVATVRELREGREMIERLARERLGMIRPGEVTYVILGEIGPPEPVPLVASGVDPSP
jgi:cell division protein FtsB